MTAIVGQRGGRNPHAGSRYPSLSPDVGLVLVSAVDSGSLDHVDIVHFLEAELSQGLDSSLVSRVR